MVKKLLVASLCAAVVLVSSSAFAADVVITKRGKKYHLATCNMIKDKKTATLDEQQAKMRGLKPCPVCFKTKEEKNNTEKTEKLESKEDPKLKK